MISTTERETSKVIQLMSVATQDVIEGIGVVDTADIAAINTQNISTTTEEQLASMEEIAASANYLSTMAGELQMFVGKFKV